MNHKLKEAFHSIHAEEDLKENTKAFLSERTRAYKTGTRRVRALVPAAACLLFLFAAFGGYQIYYVPVTVISVDINPSLELGINRVDKVISVEAYNSDGEKLAKELDIRHMNYTDALEQIMSDEHEHVAAGEVSITVIGADENRCSRMLSNIEDCTGERQNTHCSSANYEELMSAHDVGLSYGKYKAYLELQAWQPEVTPEEIQGMTMREIEVLIQELSGGNADATQGGSADSGYDSGYGSGHEHSGHGGGCGQE